MDDPIARDDFSRESSELVDRIGTPDTISEWKAVADGLLTSQCCPLHRNMEISSRYAWLYKSLPSCFKWAGMAALASHHVRLALFPLRLNTDRSGYVDVPPSLFRRKLLLIEDVNTIRATNNAIFDDIFWVHLAYVSAGDGIGRLRALLGSEHHYAPVLAGFETIERGRLVLADRPVSADVRQAAEDLIWKGNIQLLEHEQRALVQPNFDRLSCAFARLISIGSATTFEARGIRPDAAYFTSFYLSSLPRAFLSGLVPVCQTTADTNYWPIGAWRLRRRRLRAWPRITRFEDRWWWVVTSVVPRFRRFDADPGLIDASLRRIVDEARVYASTPCVLPRQSATAGSRTT